MHKPSDSVRIVIFDQDNSETFLILSEKDDPKNFKLPGGKFENQNETPDAAAQRELFEELGVNLKLRRVGELVNDDGISRRYIYSVTVNKVDVKPSKEIDRVKWIKKEVIPEGKNKTHILSAVELV